jgi:hypothetical protein
VDPDGHGVEIVIGAEAVAGLGLLATGAAVLAIANMAHSETLRQAAENLTRTGDKMLDKAGEAAKELAKTGMQVDCGMGRKCYSYDSLFEGPSGGGKGGGNAEGGGKTAEGGAEGSKQEGAQSQTDAPRLKAKERREMERSKKQGPENGTPRNNDAQNKQFRDATRGLSEPQRRQIHDQISGQNLSYKEIKEIADSMRKGSGRLNRPTSANEANWGPNPPEFILDNTNGDKSFGGKE